MIKVAWGNISIVCKQCNKILIGKKKLIGHMESHKKIICPFCEKSIPKNSRLNHKCSNSERFLCELCPYESSRKDMLKRHMNTHNKKPKKVIKHNCTFCTKSFLKDSHLKEQQFKDPWREPWLQSCETNWFARSPEKKPAVNHFIQFSEGGILFPQRFHP